MDNKVEVDGGGGWIALAILIIAFWGEPDLAGSLIDYLQVLTENAK